MNDRWQQVATAGEDPQSPESTLSSTPKCLATSLSKCLRLLERTCLVRAHPPQLLLSICISSTAAMATMLAGSQMLVQTQRSSLAGTTLRQPAQRAALRPARQAARAESDTKEKEKKKDEKKGPFSPPALDSSWPSPIFGGSTGGLMRKAQVGAHSYSVSCNSAGNIRPGDGGIDRQRFLGPFFECNQLGIDVVQTA